MATGKSNLRKAKQKEVEKPKEKQIQAAFQTRKNIADYVRENLLLKERKSYFQRIIIITKHFETTDENNLKLKRKINKIVKQCNNNLQDEKLTGLYLQYSGYSTMLIEGSEEVVGTFLDYLTETESKYFTKAKVVVLQNNVNTIHFNRLIWRSADSPLLADPFSSTGEDQCVKQTSIVISTLLTLCKTIKGQLESEGNPDTQQKSDDEHLTSDYNRLMPEIQRIDFLINAEHLQTVAEVNFMFQNPPEIEDTDYGVWPIPYDYMPTHVFDTCKYDINLTFKTHEKK